MNFLKKGPELKLSELKIPDFVYNLYYDLKERHLLPLVVILLVALVAVPIILERSNHSSDKEPGATMPTATASTAAGGEEALVVARTEPGLRELKRRFKHYRALDPFAEKTPAGATAGAGAEAEAEEPSGEAGEPAPPAAEAPPTEATVVGGAVSEPPPVEIESSPPVEIPSAPVEVPTEPSGSESSDQGGPTRTRFASNAIDVRIVSVPRPPTSDAGTKAKAKRKPKAEVRRDLPELTMLPARATPAAAFMGTTRDGKKALFLVSSDVVSLFGEGTCVIGSQTCQLLALEPGLPETFVYGPQEHTYRIELLKIERTLSAKPRRAALGATKGAKKGEGQSRETEAGDTEPTEPVARGEAAESPAG
jgi:hypothetical protein